MAEFLEEVLGGKTKKIYEVEWTPNQSDGGSFDIFDAELGKTILGTPQFASTKAEALAKAKEIVTNL